MSRKILWIIKITIFLFLSGKTFGQTTKTIGQKIDSLNGVYVYENGNPKNIVGRNTTKDGYNLGLKYQCVEFVKRYYYEYLSHKMPNTYGDAKDFFDKTLADGAYNEERDLIQYTNPSKTFPEVDDLLIFKPTEKNPFGHVAIISEVNKNQIEIIQQNPVETSTSREKFKLKNTTGKWKIQEDKIIGWLRK